MVSLFLLLLQPIVNGQVRKGENEADQYSLDNVNLPDALATALVEDRRVPESAAGRARGSAVLHPPVSRATGCGAPWTGRHPIRSEVDSL